MALNGRVHSAIAGILLEDTTPSGLTSAVWKSNNRTNCAVHKEEQYTEL